jgi:citrate transporter
VKSEKVYKQIDWPLLLMFMGLFIVVAGFDKAVLTPETISAATRLHLDQLPVLSLVTAALSNLVSNVPAVLVLKPFVANLPDPPRAWLAIAMASTLAGNLTLVGSVANQSRIQQFRPNSSQASKSAFLRSRRDQRKTRNQNHCRRLNQRLSMAIAAAHCCSWTTIAVMLRSIMIRNMG